MPKELEKYKKNETTLFSFDKIIKISQFIDNTLNLIKKPELSYFFEQIHLFELNKDWNNLIDITTEAIFHYSDLVYFNIIRGKAFKNISNYQLAINDYLISYDLDNNYYVAFYYLYILYEEMNELNKALEYLNKFIQIEIDDFELYKERAELKEKLGDFKGKEEDENIYTNRLKERHSSSSLQRNYFNYYPTFHNLLSDYLTVKINLYPDCADLYLCRALYGCGGIEDLTKCIELEPDNYRAYFHRGMKYKYECDIIESVCQVLGDKIENLREKQNKMLQFLHLALNDFDRVKELNSSIEEVYFYSASLQMKSKDFVKAIEDYIKVIELDPEYLDAYYWRAYSKRKLSDWQGAIKDYTKVIELDSDYLDAYYWRAKTKEKIEDWQGAIEDYTRTIELDSTYIDAYYNLANTKLKISDFQGAVNDYTEVIEIDSKYKDALYLRAKTKEKIGDIKGAIEDYIIIYYRRALKQDELCDWLSSIEVYSKVIDFDQSYTKAYYWRAKAKEKMEDWQGAIEDYTKIIKFDQKFLLAYYWRAKAKEKMEDWQGSLQDYRNLIEFDPNNTLAFYERAIIKERTDDWLGAIDDYSRIIEIEPGFIWSINKVYELSYQNYNWTIFEKNKDYQNAEEYYANVIEVDPEYKSVLYRRAKAKEKNGDWQGAIEDYKKEIQLHPDNELAKQHLRILTINSNK